MVKHYIVADFRSFSDYYARAMVNEETLADPSPGMYFYAAG